MAENLCSLRKKGGGGKYREYVLWTNPNPTSAMAAGTIATCSDDFENYDYIAIDFKVSASSDRLPQTTYWKAEEFISYKGVNSPGQYNRGCIGTVSKAQSEIYYRPLRVTDTNKVEFNYGKYTVTSSGTNTQADNSSAVPVAIKGIKESSGSWKMTADLSDTPDALYTNANMANNGTATLTVTQKPKWIVATFANNAAAKSFIWCIINVEEEKGYRYGYYSSAFQNSDWTNYTNYITSITDSAVSIKNAYGGACIVEVAAYY